MKAFVTLSAALAVLSLSSGAALAQAACTPAVPPPRPTVASQSIPAQPAVPACNESKKKCTDKEAAAYNQALAAYNGAVEAQNGQVAIANTYIKAMDQYADQVKTYMACERQAIAAVLGQAKP